MGGNPESQVSRETLAFEYWISHTVLEIANRDSALTGFQAGVAWHRLVVRHDNRAQELSRKATTKALLRRIATANDDEWQLNNYHNWTRDELINRILDQEYPEVRPRPGL